jgi:opacity protein-like surface antigen
MKKNFSHFRKAALAATVAACAIAVPAQARDGEGYIGLDAGIVIPQDTKIDVGAVNNAIVVDNKKRFDVDVVVGYDWGMIRTEAEFAHKEWGPKSFTSSGLLDPAAGVYPPANGETKVNTAMANALLDFGGNGGVGFAVGVGAGRAWNTTRLATAPNAIDFLDDSDSAWAWQGLAQLRVPLTDNIEVGLKYRYLNTNPFVMVDIFGRTNRFDARSHSLMASILVNFGGHAAPPPPPPPPPQTKTCPDGSVVGISDNCPVPPPPVVAPQGERG